VKKKVLSDKLS